MMDCRTFLAGTGAVLLASPLAAEAQQGKVYWIGVLPPGSPDSGSSALAGRPGGRVDEGIQ